jgi:hypothetical protein
VFKISFTNFALKPSISPLLPFGLVPPVPLAAHPRAIKTQNFVHIHIVTRLHLRILSKTPISHRYLLETDRSRSLSSKTATCAAPRTDASRASKSIVVNVERRHICNQIVGIAEDTDYATVPLFLTRNDDLRKLWMKKSPQ